MEITPVQIGTILNNVATLIANPLEDGGLGLGLENVQISNIAFNETDSSESRLIISLVNVEEEKTLRYAQTQSVLPGPEPTVYTHNPVVFINLYLLFSFPRENDLTFTTSLNDLGSLLAFFQKKYVFSADDLELPETGTQPAFGKLIFELYSLSFEQMNHLWGVLGGKYIPSVMYKVRLMPIKVEPEIPEALIKREQANLTNP